MLKASVGLYADNMHIHRFMQDECFHVIERLLRDGFVIFRLLAVTAEAASAVDISDSLNNDGRNTIVFELKKRTLFWKRNKITTVESAFVECNKAPRS